MEYPKTIDECVAALNNTTATSINISPTDDAFSGIDIALHFTFGIKDEVLKPMLPEWAWSHHRTWPTRAFGFVVIQLSKSLVPEFCEEVKLYTEAQRQRDKKIAAKLAEIQKMQDEVQRLYELSHMDQSRYKSKIFLNIKNS